MSKALLYATGNDVKFARAEGVALELGYDILMSPLDLTEIQSDNGRDIAAFKVTQAYQQLRSPVVVSDDIWVIPGLGGFPGPYMKYMNDWLSAEDLLRLTLPLSDRRIILRQHVAYQDEHGIHHFESDITGILLTEIRGSHKYAHTTITSFNDGKDSFAETIARGELASTTLKDDAWHEFGAWYLGGA